MGLFKKKIVKKTYEREHMKPVIRASICTGEEVAGFKDIRTGKIEEIMLIRSPEDLEKFKEIYEITEEIAKEYQRSSGSWMNVRYSSVSLQEKRSYFIKI